MKQTVTWRVGAGSHCRSAIEYPPVVKRGAATRKTGKDDFDDLQERRKLERGELAVGLPERSHVRQSPSQQGALGEARGPE